MSSPCRENITLPFFGKIWLSACIPLRLRGALRDRHERWRRDAVDASRAIDERVRYGRPSRVVPIPRRWNQALRDERKATVANKPGAPRRSRISRKAIAQGTPVVSAALWFLACAKCTFLCTQGSRVRPASGTPCALCIEGDVIFARLGRGRAAGTRTRSPGERRVRRSSKSEGGSDTRGRCPRMSLPPSLSELRQTSRSCGLRHRAV